MAKINIVLADTDELFLNHLDSYLIEHISNFEVASFTSSESLLNYLNEKHKIDVIAFSEDLMDDAIAAAKIPAKIVLSDGSFFDFSDFKPDEFRAVNKYQKADKFINEILMIYAEKTGRVEVVSHGDKRTRLLGFYSPVGGSGKTTLAVAVASALAGRGQRVFYLNAEKINSTAGVFNQGPQGSMTDVYLAAKGGSADVGLQLMAGKFVDSRTGVTYANPAESSLEINELSAEEFVRILQALVMLAEFDTVIVDFDSEFTWDKAAQLQQLDKIFVPFTADEMSFAKIGLFIKELQMRDDMRALLNKMDFVLNRANTQSEAQVQQSDALAGAGLAATVMLSPALSSLKNISYAGSTVQTTLARLLENV